MNKFKYKLKELIEESNKTQVKIANEIGITKQTLTNYKSGFSEPNLDQLIIIAKYFDVTTDYLLGIED